jgi:hypothetical protein
MPEIKYQEDEDSEVVCCSCVHNIRHPVKGDLARIECYCALDNHYIGYIQNMSNYCDEWKRSERLRGDKNETCRC